jgi:hypothetical protein
MTPEQLRDQADKKSKLTHLSTKNSIRMRFETAAANGCYKIKFDSNSYDGPFLLPESARKAFLEDLTKEGFKVECETRWWKRKTITISWSEAREISVG